MFCSNCKRMQPITTTSPQHAECSVCHTLVLDVAAEAAQLSSGQDMEVDSAADSGKT
jgi:hypothetical protein